MNADIQGKVNSTQELCQLLGKVGSVYLGCTREESNTQFSLMERKKMPKTTAGILVEVKKEFGVRFITKVHIIKNIAMPLTVVLHKSMLGTASSQEEALTLWETFLIQYKALHVRYGPILPLVQEEEVGMIMNLQIMTLLQLVIHVAILIIDAEMVHGVTYLL